LFRIAVVIGKMAEDDRTPRYSWNTGNVGVKHQSSDQSIWRPWFIHIHIRNKSYSGKIRDDEKNKIRWMFELEKNI
jgi:hypothetical protein